MAETWREEFGEGYAVPAVVVAGVRSGWLWDRSWHNDAAPSFRLAWDAVAERLRGGDEWPDVRLWVEHPSPAMREGGAAVERFAVTVGEADGSGRTVYAGGDVLEALDALERVCRVCGREADAGDGWCKACEAEALSAVGDVVED